MGTLIRSGSQTPGIDPDAFRLPPGTAIRYERPADQLASLLPSYAVLDSDPAIWRGRPEWLLPSWAQVWIVLTEGIITVKIGRRQYDPLSSAILYGVTSRAMQVTAQGGVTVVIDVSPMGWARLFKPAADALRDRITPLQALLPAGQVEALATRLYESDRDSAVKDIIDGFFLEHMPPPDRNEPIIAKMMTLLADETGADDLIGIAKKLGISPPTFLRISKRYFGFTPKMLMMRARFLRALTSMLTDTDAIDFSYVPPGYHNVPHFIRDANRFLGMTPRRFLAMDMPYLCAALRARKLVLGVTTPSLD
ncbi:MAG: helix-turn-helix domain-containing protein [Sphingomonas sp.]